MFNGLLTAALLFLKLSHLLVNMHQSDLVYCGIVSLLAVFG